MLGSSKSSILSALPGSGRLRPGRCGDERLGRLHQSCRHSVKSEKGGRRIAACYTGSSAGTAPTLEHAISSKSDNDNHSNQLNPNNDEYSHSRGGGNDDDDDEPAPRATPPFLGGTRHNARPDSGVAYYVVAAVGFSGKSVHVRFKVPFKLFLGEETGTRADDVAASVKAMVLRELLLGIAYTRMGRDQERGRFTWFSPVCKQSQLPPVRDGESAEMQRTRAWYGGVRDLANHLEHHFDMLKQDTALDLGLVEHELAP